MNVPIIPEICISDARGAIAFYKKAFGAKDLGTHATPDGKRIMHGALELNGGVVFVRDDFPERSGGQKRSPKALGGTPVTIHLNCSDVHKAWKKALAAGAKVVMPLEKQFWGDTYGILDDPFAQRWSMSGAHGEKPDTKSKGYEAGAEEMFPTAKAKRRPTAKRPTAKTAKRKA